MKAGSWQESGPNDGGPHNLVACSLEGTPIKANHRDWTRYNAMQGFRDRGHRLDAPNPCNPPVVMARTRPPPSSLPQRDGGHGPNRGPRYLLFRSLIWPNSISSYKPIFHLQSSHPNQNVLSLQCLPGACLPDALPPQVLFTPPPWPVGPRAQGNSIRHVAYHAFAGSPTLFSQISKPQPPISPYWPSPKRKTPELAYSGVVLVEA